MPIGAEVTSGSRLRDDGFSTFLREMHAQRDPVSEDAESRIMGTLTDGRERDVAQLLVDVEGLPLSPLLTALDALQRFGLVERAGVPGQATFRLTPSGVRASAVIGASRGRP